MKWLLLIIIATLAAAAPAFASCCKSESGQSGAITASTAQSEQPAQTGGWDQHVANHEHDTNSTSDCPCCPGKQPCENCMVCATTSPAVLANNVVTSFRQNESTNRWPQRLCLDLDASRSLLRPPQILL